MYQCNSPDGAQECGCNVEGTVEASIECAEVTGECTCIDTVVGLQCDQCEDQHWNFPNCLRESFIINFANKDTIKRFFQPVHVMLEALLTITAIQLMANVHAMIMSLVIPVINVMMDSICIQLVMVILIQM